MYKEEFAERLQKARENAGYTQKQVEEFTKIKRSTLASYECGRTQPDIESLGKLIDFYEISAEWLIGTGIAKK
jgi:transcriptional regulator with XRE-family HTH domain